MPRVFNTTGLCVPEEHYMVNLDRRLCEIKGLVDSGKYFTIHRARQYGKTTTLMALSRYLRKDYYVVFVDFQIFGNADFRTESIFSAAFADTFIKALKRQQPDMTEGVVAAIRALEEKCTAGGEGFTLRPLFERLIDICAVLDKPVVLMIDEVDSATDNQVFLDFLAQLRAQYLQRFWHPALKSVILAGVYDVKNLRQKLRPQDEHRYNSPWNIAADFDIEMSFSGESIAGMLAEYENDYHTEMDIRRMADLVFDYTSGYPFLVSRLCQLVDEKVSAIYGSKKAAWTDDGFQVAVHMLIHEKNMLFDSLVGKLYDYPQLKKMLRAILFAGKTYTYMADGSVIDIATMFGFIRNDKGNVAVANRIFETRLYYFFLSEEENQDAEISMSNPGRGI